MDALPPQVDDKMGNNRVLCGFCFITSHEVHYHGRNCCLNILVLASLLHTHSMQPFKDVFVRGISKRFASSFVVFAAQLMTTRIVQCGHMIASRSLASYIFFIEKSCSSSPAVMAFCETQNTGALLLHVLHATFIIVGYDLSSAMVT